MAHHEFEFNYKLKKLNLNKKNKEVNSLFTDL